MVNIPPTPQRPELHPPAGRPWLSVLLALGFFTLLSIGFVLLSYFYFLPIFIIAAVVFCITGLHYLTWGWWLGPMIRRESPDEEAD